MAAAGILAMLRRQKAIDLLPATYRITDLGKSLLSQPEAPDSKPEKEQEAKKKGKKPKQQESGQGASP